MNDDNRESSEPDDATLVRRFQAGDGGAFDLFVCRHQDRIFRLCLAHTGETRLAEEAAQEVFLRALRGLRGFRFRAAPFTWLYRTAKHVCAESRRSERPSCALDGLPELADPADLSAAVDAQRTAMQVRALVADLPERQRDTVLLRIFEGMSVAETARALRMRPGTVKANLHKAMAGLRRRAQLSGLLTEARA